MRIAYKTLLALVCIATSLSPRPANADTLAVLEKSIAELERTEGSFSPTLYGPLRRYGLRLQDAGRHEDAAEHFRWMQTLTHREYGVRSPRQAESVEHLIRSEIALGNTRAANTQHEFLFRVMQGVHAESDPEMFRARFRLANWYRDTMQFNDALELYGKSLELIESEGENVFHVVQLLRAEALTLYLKGRCCASDRLAEASDLVQSSDAFDFAEKKRAALDHADMLMIEREVADAHEIYKSVSGIFDTDLDPAMLGFRKSRNIDLAAREGTMAFDARAEVIYMKQTDSIIGGKREDILPPMMGRPVPMCSSAVKDAAPIADREDFELYYADISLSVDTKGTPLNIDVNGNAPTALKRYLRHVLQESRYRPGIKNGFASDATLTFRQTFAPEQEVFVDGLHSWSRLLAAQTCQTRPGNRTTVASAAAD